MNEKEFWSLIETSTQGQDDFFTNLKNKLIKYSESDIILFEEILRKKIIEADHFNVMIAQKIITGEVSDDSYLYFICWIICLWEQIYNEAIKDPDFLAHLEWIVEVDPDWEDILYISDEAFEEKTWREEDDNFPRNVCFDKWINYDESLWINTKWEDWEEKDLLERAPKLCKKFKYEEESTFSYTQSVKDRSTENINSLSEEEKEKNKKAVIEKYEKIEKEKWEQYKKDNNIK